MRDRGNWSRPLIAASTAAVLALFSQPGPAMPPLPVPGINGADDRQLVRTGKHPWQAVGRVNNTLGPFCTGTLVGPRRVLTTAHCLWNPRTRDWLPPCALHFVAGYRRGTHGVHSRVVSYRLSGGEPMRHKGPPIDAAWDWAVLFLEKDLSETAGYLPTAPLDPEHQAAYQTEGGVFLQAGYSRDRPHILTLNRPCRLTGFGRDPRIVWHACDATFGDSGSPILLERGSRYDVVAILVGFDNRTRRGIAVGGAAFHERVQSLEPPNEEFRYCGAPAPVPRLTMSTQRSPQTEKAVEFPCRFRTPAPGQPEVRAARPVERPVDTHRSVGT
jgi:protease YdgD